MRAASPARRWPGRGGLAEPAARGAPPAAARARLPSRKSSRACTGEILSRIVCPGVRRGPAPAGHDNQSSTLLSSLCRWHPTIGGEARMITYEDCLAFTGLTPEAVDRLAVR